MRATRKRARGLFPRRRAGWAVHVLSFVSSRRRRPGYRCPYTCIFTMLRERLRRVDITSHHYAGHIASDTSGRV